MCRSGPVLVIAGLVCDMALCCPSCRESLLELVSKAFHHNCVFNACGCFFLEVQFPTFVPIESVQVPPALV